MKPEYIYPCIGSGRCIKYEGEHVFGTHGHCERSHLNIPMIWIKEALQKIKQWKFIRLGNSCKRTVISLGLFGLNITVQYDEIPKHCSATGIWTLSGNDI